MTESTTESTTSDANVNEQVGGEDQAMPTSSLAYGAPEPADLDPDATAEALRGKDYGIDYRAPIDPAAEGQREQREPQEDDSATQ